MLLFLACANDKRYNKSTKSIEIESIILEEETLPEPELEEKEKKEFKSLESNNSDKADDVNKEEISLETYKTNDGRTNEASIKAFESMKIQENASLIQNKLVEGLSFSSLLQDSTLNQEIQKEIQKQSANYFSTTEWNSIDIPLRAFEVLSYDLTSYRFRFESGTKKYEANAILKERYILREKDSVKTVQIRFKNLKEISNE